MNCLSKHSNITCTINIELYKKTHSALKTIIFYTTGYLVQKYTCLILLINFQYKFISKAESRYSLVKKISGAVGGHCFQNSSFSSLVRWTFLLTLSQLQFFCFYKRTVCHSVFHTGFNCAQVIKYFNTIGQFKFLWVYFNII